MVSPTFDFCSTLRGPQSPRRCVQVIFFSSFFFFLPHPRLSIFSGDGQPSAALEMSLPPLPAPPDMFVSYMRDERRGLVRRCLWSVCGCFFFLFYFPPVSAAPPLPPPSERTLRLTPLVFNIAACVLWPLTRVAYRCGRQACELGGRGFTQSAGLLQNIKGGAACGRRCAPVSSSLLLFFFAASK